MLFANCSCCFSGTCSVCVAATPAQFAISVAGITNGSCTNCNRWNGDIVLTNNTLIPLAGGPCIWSSPIETGFAPCLSGCANCSRWTLVLTSTEAELLIDGLSMGVYSLPLASFDCQGSNVLTLDVASTDCNNWPASITVTAI